MTGHPVIDQVLLWALVVIALIFYAVSAVVMFLLPFLLIAAIVFGAVMLVRWLVLDAIREAKKEP
jgi:hypothetical protein